jgi:hypothetical protein
MIKRRRRVLYEFRDEAGTVTVEFIRIPTDLPAPGFSHRVFLTGRVGLIRDWLSEDAQPNGRAARYFYDKHVAAQAAEVKP